MPVVLFILLFMGLPLIGMVVDIEFKKKVLSTVIFILGILGLGSWLVVSFQHSKANSTVKYYDIETHYDGHNLYQFSIVDEKLINIQQQTHLIADTKEQVLKVCFYKDLSYGIDWGFPPKYTVVYKNEQSLERK